MPRLRDSKGRFTKLDRRKRLYSTSGELVYVPKQGWLNRKVRERYVGPEVIGPPEPYIPVTQSRRYDASYTFTDRKKDQDLYSYFAQKKLNQKVSKLQRDNPDSVIVAKVQIRLGEKRRMVTPEFRVTDLVDRDGEPIVFLGGKRKGKHYTPKDAIAYYVHDRVNNDPTWHLYERKTDTNERVIRKGSREKYSKKQSFEISFRAVSKSTGKSIQTVANRIS